ncbi:hypothetical protein H2200_001626 [Cladophialophora chaetospira]|uniref:C2H2-type domain-containing protein n=1 Tax=Cladophialophora chaetospira TaxID=386627 RepID=A0AA39CP89_9EURO|nr:hypothetical protein H2200_001626 [Cladophialophora chaetospira]
MLLHLQSQDLVGSEGPAYPQDSFVNPDTFTASWHSHTDMSLIDPQLHYAPTYTYTDTQHNTPFDSRRSFSSYDRISHGFSPRSLRMNIDSVLPQLDVFEPGYLDLDQFRHMRHYSPTDPFGSTLSSNTDSSASDYALSPDVVRSSRELPLTYTSPGMYGNSTAMPPATASAWTSHPSFVPVDLPAPAASQHTVPSMRHLQVTPDPEHEDELLDDKDAFQHRINLPEELEISEQIISPPDSGHDRSVDDDETMMDDEEDVTVVESDSDSEFSPRAKLSRRHSSIGKRHSLREPRRPKSIIDPQARITKPSHRRQASHGSTPRAKSKKKPPVTKKTESDSKNFPCAFHHWGCCATFANKNEWKRHVSSQHLQLGYYRCDMHGCADYHKGFNDFNRKDLFTQHCRRMHAPWAGTRKGEDGVSKKEKDNFEKQLEIIRTRCWVDRRKAPHKTKCGFCGKKFIDSKESKGWDERMEHVGRHFERDNAKSEDEAIDDGLKQWAINEGVITEGKKGDFWLPGFEPIGASRGSRGQRRSKRLVKEEEEEEQEADDGIAEVEGDEEELDSIEVKHADVAVKTQESSEDEDAESESDVDAEAEVDE